MNCKASILVVALAASAAFGQSTATLGQVRSALSAPVAAKAAPATTTAAPAVGKAVPAVTKAAATPAKVSPAPSTPAKADTSAKIAAKAVKPVTKTARVAKVPATKTKSAAAGSNDKKDAVVAAKAAGRRDPFLSPIVDRVAGGAGCSTGKKCLMPDQVELQGVVRGPNGMIAVVVNSSRTAYFMRVNDPVFNGYVVKITPDSIIFKETTQDRMGKSVSREVVKKVNIPAV